MKTAINSKLHPTLIQNLFLNFKIFSLGKQIILSFLFILLLPKNSDAQATEEEISKEFYKADANINVIINYLPAGWKFSEDSGRFFVTYKDSLNIIQNNEINTPIDQRIVRTKKILPQIVLKFEPRWDFYQTQDISLKNDAVREDMRKLQVKYKINELIDSASNPKTGIKYITKNDSEKKRLNNYLKDLDRLELKIKEVPDYNSKNFSIFLIKITGLDETYTNDTKENISRDIRRILVLFREACGQ